MTLRTGLLLLPFLLTRAPSQTFEIQQTPNPLSTNNELYAAAANSTTDVWAVGQVAVHWDGASWTAVPLAIKKAILNGAAAVASNDVWAAGDVDDINSGRAHAVIEHWDGTVWSKATIPHRGVSSLLTSMTAIASNDVWAAGWFENDAETAIEPLFEHWDGTSWSVVHAEVSSDTEFITAISAAATNDVWAVGYTTNGSVNQPLSYHWDGHRWQITHVPIRGNGSNTLYGVVAPAPGQAWAVGLSTAEAPPKESPTVTLIERWDGTGWEIISSPNIGPHSMYQSNRLFGVTALGPTDIWASGSYFAASGSGDQSTLVEHYDGTNWTIVTTPNRGFSDTLFGGAAIDGSVWIPGTYFGGKPISSTLVLAGSGL
jgi:hypothetical protein